MPWVGFFPATDNPCKNGSIVEPVQLAKPESPSVVNVTTAPLVENLPGGVATWYCVVHGQLGAQPKKLVQEKPPKQFMSPP
jgi:hypothetical protein